MPACRICVPRDHRRPPRDPAAHRSLCLVPCSAMAATSLGYPPPGSASAGPKPADLVKLDVVAQVGWQTFSLSAPIAVTWTPCPANATPCASPPQAILHRVAPQNTAPTIPAGSAATASDPAAPRPTQPLPGAPALAHHDGVHGREAGGRAQAAGPGPRGPVPARADPSLPSLDPTFPLGATAPLGALPTQDWTAASLAALLAGPGPWLPSSLGSLGSQSSLGSLGGQRGSRGARGPSWAPSLSLSGGVTSGVGRAATAAAAAAVAAPAAGASKGATTGSNESDGGGERGQEGRAGVGARGAGEGAGGRQAAGEAAPGAGGPSPASGPPAPHAPGPASAVGSRRPVMRRRRIAHPAPPGAQFVKIKDIRRDLDGRRLLVWVSQPASVAVLGVGTTPLPKRVGRSSARFPRLQWPDGDDGAAGRPGAAPPAPPGGLWWVATVAGLRVKQRTADLVYDSGEVEEGVDLGALVQHREALWYDAGAMQGGHATVASGAREDGDGEGEEEGDGRGEGSEEMANGEEEDRDPARAGHAGGARDARDLLVTLLHQAIGSGDSAPPGPRVDAPWVPAPPSVPSPVPWRGTPLTSQREGPPPMEDGQRARAPQTRRVGEAAWAGGGAWRGWGSAPQPGEPRGPGTATATGAPPLSSHTGSAATDASAGTLAEALSLLTAMLGPGAGDRRAAEMGERGWGRGGAAGGEALLPGTDAAAAADAVWGALAGAVAGAGAGAGAGANAGAGVATLSRREGPGPGSVSDAGLARAPSPLGRVRGSERPQGSGGEDTGGSLIGSMLGDGSGFRRDGGATKRGSLLGEWSHLRGSVGEDTVGSLLGEGSGARRGAGLGAWAQGVWGSLAEDTVWGEGAGAGADSGMGGSGMEGLRARGLRAWDADAAVSWGPGSAQSALRAPGVVGVAGVAAGVGPVATRPLPRREGWASGPSGLSGLGAEARAARAAVGPVGTVGTGAEAPKADGGAGMPVGLVRLR